MMTRGVNGYVCWNRDFNYLLHRARAVPATMTIAKATPRTVSVQPILLNTKSRPDRKSNQSAEPETHGVNPWRAWSDYTYRTKITNGLTIFIRTYIVCTFKNVSIKIFSCKQTNEKRIWMIIICDNCCTHVYNIESIQIVSFVKKKNEEKRNFSYQQFNLLSFFHGRGSQRYRAFQRCNV